MGLLAEPPGQHLFFEVAVVGPHQPTTAVPQTEIGRRWLECGVAIAEHLRLNELRRGHGEFDAETSELVGAELHVDLLPDGKHIVDIDHSLEAAAPTDTSDGYAQVMDAISGGAHFQRPSPGPVGGERGEGPLLGTVGGPLPWAQVRRELAARITQRQRQWTHVAPNAAALRLAATLPAELQSPLNMFRASLHPDGLAAITTNFDEWATYLLHQHHRLAMVSADPALLELEREVTAYPHVHELLARIDWTHPAPSPSLLVPCELPGGSCRTVDVHPAHHLWHPS